jgi:hypothetical protein
MNIPNSYAKAMAADMKAEIKSAELRNMGANADKETIAKWANYVGKRVKINYERYTDVPKGSLGRYIAKHVEITMNLILIDGEERPRVFHIFEFDLVY